jgi:hypothetical protein
MCTCDNCERELVPGYIISTEEGYRFCTECADECTWSISYDDIGETFYYLIETDI